VEKNRAAASGVTSAGIFLESGASVLVMNNRMTGLTSGIVFSTSTGKYRDNLTSGVGTPYTGGTNAGGNQ